MNKETTLHWLRAIMLSFFSLFIFSSNAQNIRIQGSAYDSSGVTPLTGAVVTAFRASDSVLVSYVRCSTDGSFSLSLKKDTYFVYIEHPRYEDRLLYLSPQDSEETISLGKVLMGIPVKTIAEIVINVNKNRVYFKGDTMVYVADSFQVAENAVVEDLLKKLPGIKIDENGQITSQGREISQVLVDGDEFFGSDPTIATKNLGAKGVQSVQIYEKKQQDNKSGMDEKIQVMDLKLKEDAKRGYFGKVSLATDGGLIGNPTNNFPFYESELLFNRFDKKQKFSVFLLNSNTPRSNFRFGDMNKFGLENERDNSGMSMWDQSAQRNNSGIPQTLKAGIYFSDRIKNWGKIGFNYSFNRNQLNATQSSLSQYFLQDSSYYTRDSSANVSDNLSHRINFSFVAKLDSLTTFEVKPSITLDESNAENTTINEFLSSTQVSNFTSSNQSNNDSKGTTVRLESVLTRQFKKPRRELQFKYILNKTDNETVGTLFNQNVFSGIPDTLDQQKNNLNGNFLNYGVVTYTEPIAAKWKIQMEYFLEAGNTYQTRKAYNRLGQVYSVLVDTLSNAFENTRLQNRGSLSLIYEHNKHSVSAGVGIRNIQLDNYNVIGDSSILQNITNFLPRFSYNYKPGMGTRLNFNYFTRSDQPSLNDIQPVADNTNPNRIKIGNANLKPNYVHTLTFQFNRWEALTGRYVWSGINATLTDNAFATNTIYDNLGRTFSKTENVNGNFFVRAYAGGGLPVWDRKIELMPTFNGSFSRFTNLINNQENITLNPSIGGGLGLEFKFDSLEISVSQNYTYSSPKSTLNAFSSTPFSTQEYKAEIKWTLPFHFKLITDAKYTINAQRAIGFNRNILVWNAEIQRTFLSTENLIIAVQGYDLLNQNLNLQRQVNGNVITDNYTRIITRYFLLKLTYRFNKNKTKEDDFEGWH